MDTTPNRIQRVSVQAFHLQAIQHKGVDLAWQGIRLLQVDQGYIPDIRSASEQAEFQHLVPGCANILAKCPGLQQQGLAGGHLGYQIG